MHELRTPLTVDTTVSSVLVGACIGAPSERLNHRTIDVTVKVCWNKKGKDDNDRIRYKTWQGRAFDMLDDEVR